MYNKRETKYFNADTYTRRYAIYEPSYQMNILVEILFSSVVIFVKMWNGCDKYCGSAFRIK